MSVLNFEAFKINDIKIDETSNFALLDIDVCRSGDNANHIYLTKESVAKSADTLYPNPVLYKCNKFGNDFMGHEKDEMIAGAFLNETKVFEDKGETWVNGKAIIYKRYVPNVMEILKRKSGRTDVSMEIDVLQSYQDENNQTVVTEFSFIGVTLLGVAPAIPEANATVLSFSNAKEVEETYNAEHFSKYDKLNLSIPKRIKDNISSVLQRYETEKLKASSNALGIARYLVREEKASVDKIRKIDEYFKSYNTKTGRSGNEFIYSLYGGDECNKWVSALMEEIKGIDEYRHTTFGKEQEEMAESLKVNKSKDAMSDSSWGDVDKASLRKKVTEASNADSIVHDVYMVVEDGWKDAPSEKLKYPVMEVKGSELVYNRGGLASALGYAKTENDNAVVKKVEAIYKKLDLDEGDEKQMSKEDFEIEGREAWGTIIKDVHSHLGNHYYVDSVEKNKIVVTDTKTKTRYDIDADVKAGKDDKTVTADIHWDTKKKSKVQKGFDRKEDEKDEREVDDKTGTKEGEIRKKEDEDLDDDDDDDDEDDDDEKLAKKDKKKAKMANDNVYTEPSALLELLNKQAEVNDKLAKEYTEDEMFASLFEDGEDFAECEMAKLHDDEREVYCKNLMAKMSCFEKADSEERLSKLTVADMTKLARKMAKMCKMAKDSTKVLLDENKELKKFKKDAEEKAEMEARDKKADEVLSKACEDLSKEEMAELKEESKKFSFASISVWENKVISKAYENAKKNKTQTESFSAKSIKVTSPWANETRSKVNDSDKLW